MPDRRREPPRGDDAKCPPRSPMVLVRPPPGRRRRRSGCGRSRGRRRSREFDLTITAGGLVQAPRGAAHRPHVPRADRGRAAEPRGRTRTRLEGGRAALVTRRVRHPRRHRLRDPARPRVCAAAAILGPATAASSGTARATYRKAAAGHAPDVPRAPSRAAVMPCSRSPNAGPRAFRRRLPRAALAIRERRDAGELVGHGLALAIGRLKARTDRSVVGRVRYPPNHRRLQHLRTERPALLTCL